MTTSVTCVSAEGAEVRTDLTALLTSSSRELVHEETRRWIKRLRLVRYGGQTMRQRFVYRGDSLWWFTELYLHKMRRLEHAVSTVIALDAARAASDPARILVETSDPVIADAASAWSRARAVPVEVTGRLTPIAGVGGPSYLVGLSATLSRLRSPTRRPPPARRRVAAFIHSAFWRAAPGADGPGQESYIGLVLDALSARMPADDLTYVGVGPRRNFRARRWWDPIVDAGAGQPLVIPVEQMAPRAALAESRAIWARRHALAREIIEGDDVRAAAFVLDCDLWAVLRPELERVALLQWPWSARTMDEAGAALDALRPDVALTYAEAGGWGRALILEARRRGVPAVGLQHGFIYRHWLNYRHEPDETQADGSDRGFPYPDRTLVFDRYAAEHLETAGQFPRASVAVTGSARLDELSTRLAHFTQDDREVVRREHGVSPSEQLVLLAAKFTEVEHELPALFAAVSTRASVRLVVKTHPAETAAGYTALAGGLANITVAEAGADLARLLAAADALVTMNSTVAIDGLVLGVPALVVGLPNNLSPFVDAGVMMGAADAPVGEALDALLYDRTARDALLARAATFTHRYDMRADGRAAARAADEILKLRSQ